MSFKHHYSPIVEAKVDKVPSRPDLSRYEDPTPRSKFQKGDIVVVRIPKRDRYVSEEAYFRVYHPKFCVPYMNAVGVVRSFFSTGYITKYAIEVEDGNLVPIATPFLIGPFRSVDVAKKYQGNNNKITSSDFKGFTGNIVEFDSRVEDEFMESFCNDEVGFEWIEKPIVIRLNNNIDVYVLAFKKNIVPLEGESAWHFDSNTLAFVNKKDWNRLDKDVEERPEYDNGFVFFKTVDRLTGKLKATSACCDVMRSGKYFLQQPDFKSWFMMRDDFVDGKTTKNIFDVRAMPIGPMIRNTKNYILNMFKFFEEGLSDGFEIFKLVYNIDESSSIIKASGEIDIMENVLGSHMKEIVNYELKSEKVSIRYKDGATSIGVLPKKISASEFNIDGASHTTIFTNLEGLEKCDLSSVKRLQVPPVHSLVGFPVQMNKPGKRVTFESMYSSNSEGVRTLKGIPDIVYADLVIKDLRSYLGAQNCVALGSVDVRHSTENLDGFFKEAENFKSWNVTDEDIAKHKRFRVVTDILPELDGMF